MDGHLEAGEVMAGPQREAAGRQKLPAGVWQTRCFRMSSSETWLPYLRSGLNYEDCFLGSWEGGVDAMGNVSVLCKLRRNVHR